jgi:tetratricopeptide (TPR) repeat protein
MQRSAEVLEEAARDDPSNSRVQMNLVYTYNRIGDRLTKANRIAAAAQSFRQSIAAGERAVEKDAKDVATRRILAVSLDSYGTLLARDGRHDEGLAFTRKAVMHAEECVNADPAVFINALLRPRSLGWMGSALFAKALSPQNSDTDRRRQLKEAASWLQKSVEAWKPLEKYPEFAKNYAAERDRITAQLAKCVVELK